MTPTKIDYARLAAFLDGEGTIAIRRIKRGDAQSYQMRVEIMVTNTDPRLMTWLKERFGGCVGRGGNSGVVYKCFKWRIECKRAHDLLVKCLPYFVIKREQAELAIAFRKTVVMNGRTKSNEVIRERMALKAALQQSRTAHLEQTEGVH